MQPDRSSAQFGWQTHSGPVQSGPLGCAGGGVRGLGGKAGAAVTLAEVVPPTRQASATYGFGDLDEHLSRQVLPAAPNRWVSASGPSPDVAWGLAFGCPNPPRPAAFP